MEIQQGIDKTINMIIEESANFNNDPEHTLLLEFLALKDFDKSADGRFAMVRKSQLIGPLGAIKFPVWTQRYWWEIKKNIG
jgi:hypothetical protein